MSNKPRRVIQIELWPASTQASDNQGATERTAARIQFEHDVGSGLTMSQAVSQGTETPAAISPDSLRDHVAEARIMAAAEPRLDSIVKSNRHVIKSLLGEGVENFGAAALVAGRVAIDKATKTAILAELKLADIISRCVGFWSRSTPTPEQLAHDSVKRGCFWLVARVIAEIKTWVS